MENLDRLKKCYEEFANGVSNEWDVFASDAVYDKMEENGAETWGEDRIYAQYGMERMRQILRNPSFEAESWEEMILDDLEARLRDADETIPEDEEKQKDIYARILAVCEDTDACIYTGYTLHTLKRRVAEGVKQIIYADILPEILQQQETAEAAYAIAMCNPGAIAAAQYLVDSDARIDPELLGSSAELISCAAGMQEGNGTQTERNLAEGLFRLAVSLAVKCHLLPSYGIFPPPLACVLEQNTSADPYAEIVRKISAFKSTILAGFAISTGRNVMKEVCSSLHKLLGTDDSGYEPDYIAEKDYS